MYFSYYSDYTDILEYLIKKKADVNAVSDTNDTALLWAVQSSNDMIFLICNKMKISNFFFFKSQMYLNR